MIRYGYDLSEHNGDIDLSKCELDFVMLRVGYSRKLDRKFKNYLKQCRNLGIDYGIYYYSYSISRDDAREAAEWCFKQLEENGCFNDYLFTYPIALDIEDADNWKHKTITERKLNQNYYEIECGVIDEWKRFIESKECFLQLYCNYSDYNNLKKVDKNLIESLSLWLAYWGVDKTPIKCDTWQYSSDSLDYRGLRVDTNINYTDFPILSGRVSRETIDGEKDPLIIEIEAETLRRKMYEKIDESIDELLTY